MQDTLKTRQACILATQKALSNRQSVIVDRTNISIEQRRYFLDIADAYGVQHVVAVFFDYPLRHCAHHIMSRGDHPNLGASHSSISVLLRFAQLLERPCLAEGFSEIKTITSFKESDDCVEEFIAQTLSPSLVVDTSQPSSQQCEDHVEMVLSSTEAKENHS